MSDDILTPPDLLCAECGLPYGDPVHTGDGDVEDEARERAEIERAVAVRVEEKLAFHRRVAALVEFKLARARGDTPIPRPRTDDLDRLELARIRKLAVARDFKHRVDQKVQALKMERGDAEFIVPPGSLSTRPTRALRLAMFGPNAKDAPDDERFETR